MDSNSPATPPEESTIVCSFCSRGASLYVFPVEPRAVHARCPNCNHGYRLLTRFVTQVQARPDRKGRLHYDFLTRESGGRERMRSVASAAVLKLGQNRWFTFVWRGNRLVGVADQSEGFWLPVKTVEQNTSFDRLWRLVGWVCLALALVQLVRLIGFARATVSHGSSSIILMLLFALILLAPLAQWALEVAGGDEDEDDPILRSDPFSQQ